MTAPGKPDQKTGFSNAIDLRRLEREARSSLYAGFLLALVVHALVGLLIPYRGIERDGAAIPSDTGRRMTVDIIEIPPSVRNPFLDWKGPQRLARGRTALNRGRPVMPGGAPRFKETPGFTGPLYRLRSEDFGVDTDALIRAIVRGEMDKVARQGIRDPEKFRLEPYPEMKLTRRPSGSLGRVNLRTEMLRVEDLSTEKYKGLLVIDPSDERNLKGYLSIPSGVYGERLRTPEETRRAVTGLANALRQHTGVIVRPDSQTILTSPGLTRFPLVIIGADDAFDLSEDERSALRKYLRNGGFAFLEAYGDTDPNLPPKGAGPLRQMLRDALGADGELRPIPEDHSLFHCYFDFESPPHRKRESAVGGQLPEVLEGVWVGESLVAVYSEKGYAPEWGRPGGSEEFARFGVNLTVYVLSRPDGISLRMVDESNWR